MSKYNTLYFLSQLGGAVTITVYLQKYMFRAGLLSHMTFESDWIKNMEVTAPWSWIARHLYSIIELICSGRDLCHTSEVWGRINDIYRLYKHLLLSGVYLKFATTPWPWTLTKTHGKYNFKSESLSHFINQNVRSITWNLSECQNTKKSSQICMFNPKWLLAKWLPIGWG